ncbi:MAG: flagellar basal-body rod protein FlgG [Bdellovibrionales bacterium RIFOXYD1_FULL_53_11]|nr:MAG: flagellar basal-body rod protein FlgG [Bdellovibrionales bacterium RIFOXYD1_FULL_53_11]
MIRALTTAASGLSAQSANIERISNDLANVNTDSYKRGRTEFQDLMYETLKEPGGQIGAGSQTPVGIQAGMGVKVGATYKIFEQGPARMTYNINDMMIEGTGFLPVQLPNGEIAYTRNGAFHRDSQGKLVLSNGAQLIPQVTIPSNALGMQISNGGEIKVQLPGQGEAVIGQIQLMNFVNEQGLRAVGESLYQPTAASGQPLQGIPGENGYGMIQQGALEGSNVNVPNSMVDMITTQRAYEMNTKVMGVADQMLGATVNVK